MIDTNSVILQQFIKNADRRCESDEKDLDRLEVVRCYSMTEYKSESETIYCFYADFVDCRLENDKDDFTATIYFRVTEYTHRHSIKAYTSTYETETKSAFIEYMNMFDIH